MRRPWSYSSADGYVLDPWLRWLVFVVLPLSLILASVNAGPRHNPYGHLPVMDQLDMWYEDELLSEKRGFF